MLLGQRPQRAELDFERLAGGTTDRWRFSWFDGPTKEVMRAILTAAPPHTARIELSRNRTLTAAAA